MFQVPEDEQNMHDCPSCGYTGHEDEKPKKVRFSVNLWFTQPLEDDEEYPSQRDITAIEKDIIKHLTKAEFNDVDCEVVNHEHE